MIPREKAKKLQKNKGNHRVDPYRGNPQKPLYKE